MPVAESVVLDPGCSGEVCFAELPCEVEGPRETSTKVASSVEVVAVVVYSLGTERGLE